MYLEILDFPVRKEKWLYWGNFYGFWSFSIILSWTIAAMVSFKHDANEARERLLQQWIDLNLLPVELEKKYCNNG